jgi:hypothetical protein
LEEAGMGVGSVWLPIVFCLGMMAVCAAGPLLGRWQRARRRPPLRPPTVNAKTAASADGSQKEWVDG